MASACHFPPEQSDLEELRVLAESDAERGLPVDELAREVILREVRRNRERAAAANAGPGP
jgi:hypothetical protein